MNSPRYSLLFLVLILFMFSITASAGQTGQFEYRISDEPVGSNGAIVPVVAGEVIVSFDRAVGKRIARKIAKEYGLDLRRQYDKRGLCLLSQNPARLAKLKKKIGSTRLSHMIKALRKDPRIRAVEPNAICNSGGYEKPDDPKWRKQWNLRDWDKLAMGFTWDDETGDEEIVIAILDSGVAYETYFDGLLQYEIMEDFNPSRFVPGYDFVNDDDHANDDFNHGTHMAGIICSDMSNEIGVAGMAPDCSIMPVKILNNEGVGTVLNLIEGIDFAVANGASIINLSVSFATGYIPGEALYQAVLDAHNAGVILVAAAGNEGLSNVCYPAAFNECIAVGSINSDKERAAYSNWGDALDVMAPGGDTEDRDYDGMADAILAPSFAEGQPTTDAGYWLGCGTSQATAHVSALAGLLLSNGVTGTDLVRNVILKTARDMNESGWDITSGYGLIRPYRALRDAGSVSVDPLDQLEGYVDGNVGVALPDGFVGLVMQFPDRIVYFQESPDSVCVNDSCYVEKHLYAMVEWASPSDSIAVYDMGALTLQEIMDFPGGPLDYIEDQGGIIQFLNDTGGLIMFLDDTGGLIMFLDDTGGLIMFLDDTGGLIMFLDDTGGLIQFLNDTGGLIQFLNDTGGLIQFLNDTGGMFGTCSESGLYAGAIDLNGSSVDPIEGTNFDQLQVDDVPDDESEPEY